MPAPKTLQVSEIEEFDSLLPSKAFNLPFQGHYGRVRMILNGENCMGFDEESGDVVKDITKRQQELMREGERLGIEWNTGWGSHQRRKMARGMSLIQRLNAIASIANDTTLFIEERYLSVKDFIQREEEAEEAEETQPLGGATIQLEGGDTVEFTQEGYEEAEARYSAMVNKLTDEMKELNLQRITRLCAWLTVKIENWPFKSPKPNPLQPDSFRVFAYPVLRWIVDVGRVEVTQEITNPQSTTRSSRTGSR